MWQRTPFGRQSSELTPFYIDRYNGPRCKQTLESHDFWELACVVSGKGILRSARDMHLGCDMLVLIPPKTEHTELSESDIDIIWIGFHSPRLADGVLTSPSLLHNVELSNKVQDMWVFAIGRDEAIGPELEAMLQLIVARFFRLRSDDRPTADKDIVDAAISYLHQHYTDAQPLAGLIQHTGFCSRYLRRLFLKRVGSPPQQYLMKIRIEHARRLLDDTELSIREVTTRTGFNDPFYFSRTFRRLCGVSPRTFRCRLRQNSPAYDDEHHSPNHGDNKKLSDPSAQ